MAHEYTLYVYILTVLIFPLPVAPSHNLSPRKHPPGYKSRAVVSRGHSNAEDKRGVVIMTLI